MTLLRRVTEDEAVRSVAPAVDAQTLAGAAEIVRRVRTGGASAVREYAERFGERREADPLVLDRDAMRAALEFLDAEDRRALTGASERIETFARAQREAIGEVTVAIPGGEAGHTIEPAVSAGCYAPGGRYPLPSSVLMTAITARVAGCERVVVASPGAHPVSLAAAAIAGADAFLAVGGAHAIAALAYGFDGFERCDVVVGPGNRWVTAAKQVVSGVVGIDMLAGPSELLVIADAAADPALIAADLLAQAEHDVDAVAMLVTESEAIAAEVKQELQTQLQNLETAEVARRALTNGFVCVVDDLDRCVALVDRIAPEHLEIMTRDAQAVAGRVRNAGGVFIGARSAEVLGDYGAGPNHTLPTGGTARFCAGLSVMHFLRLRTWLRIDEINRAGSMLGETVRIASMEGLAGHAASARARVVRADDGRG